jgi:hypothetical protein
MVGGRADFIRAARGYGSAHQSERNATGETIHHSDLHLGDECSQTLTRGSHYERKPVLHQLKWHQVPASAQRLGFQLRALSEHREATAGKAEVVVLNHDFEGNVSPSPVVMAWRSATRRVCDESSREP